jgi:hypothetical protein
MLGPCLQHVNESTSTQVTYNIETLNQHHEEYDQTAHSILATDVLYLLKNNKGLLVLES